MEKKENRSNADVPGSSPQSEAGGQPLLVVTGNKKKIREFRALIPYSMEFMDLDIDEIQGTHEEVLRHKALSAYNIIGKDLIIDDSGMYCEALNGFPGPYTKDFLKIGLQKIYSILKNNNNIKTKNVCMLSYVRDGVLHVFKGEVDVNFLSPPEDPRHLELLFDNQFPTIEDRQRFLDNNGICGVSEFSHRKKAVDAFLEFYNKTK